MFRFPFSAAVAVTVGVCSLGSLGVELLQFLSVVLAPVVTGTTLSPGT